MRVLGVPVSTPAEVLEKAVDGSGAALRLARSAPDQLERILRIGEHIVAVGRELNALGERLDARGAQLAELGSALNERAQEIARLGRALDARAEQLLAKGAEINALGDRIDVRGAAIVNSADHVVDTGEKLIEVLPTLERALALAAPLEGAIDRVGRFVDRLPGGGSHRRLPRHRTDAADESAPRPGADQL